VPEKLPIVKVENRFETGRDIPGCDAV